MTAAVTCPSCGRDISAKIPATEVVCPRDAFRKRLGGKVSQQFDIPIDIVIHAGPPPAGAAGAAAAMVPVASHSRALADQSTLEVLSRMRRHR